ncbi:MAG: hypothetical protein V4607_07095 [Pseudomonadota bacterium]
MTTKTKRDWLEPPSWWKKWKPLRILALGVIGVSILSTTWTVKKYVLPPTPHPLTEFYTATVGQKVALGTFQSYSTLETVRAALTKDGYTFVTKSSHTPFSELYPPHDMDTLSVESYTHLDNDGALNLEFFNNRLYEVEFVPEDPASYARALRGAYPDLKRNRIGDALFLSGALRISSNVDLVRSDVGQSLRARPFVIWQDLRLTRQRDQWDREYGETPVKAY